MSKYGHYDNYTRRVDMAVPHNMNPRHNVNVPPVTSAETLDFIKFDRDQIKHAIGALDYSQAMDLFQMLGFDAPVANKLLLAQPELRDNPLGYMAVINILDLGSEPVDHGRGTDTPGP